MRTIKNSSYVGETERIFYRFLRASRRLCSVITFDLLPFLPHAVCNTLARTNYFYKRNARILYAMYLKCILYCRGYTPCVPIAAEKGGFIVRVRNWCSRIFLTRLLFSTNNNIPRTMLRKTRNKTHSFIFRRNVLCNGYVCIIMSRKTAVDWSARHYIDRN